MATKRPTVISLFTGIGGLDFGFEAAGFETRVAVELDKVACQTARLNRSHWTVIEDDIHSVSSQEILDAGGLKAGEADVLIGGPPCQPFSKSGYWVNGDAARLDDPRADTLTAFLRVLRDTRPKSFILENVYGLIYKGKDEGLQHILSGIDQINSAVGTNYSVNWQVLNAANYGVPQIRERVFLVGCRDGKRFEFPQPTHSKSENQTGIENLLPHKTAWDAIGDLSAHPNEPSLTIGGKWGPVLPSIPEGQNYLWHTNRGGGQQLFGWRTRYWSFLLKLAKNLPSWTIQAQPGSSIGPFHWKNRKLTAAEMCRLQTFPDGLIFDCGRTDIQKMLGNAVPSLLAEVLARSLREQVHGEKQSGSYVLMPPVRTPVPDPEPVRPLAEQYSEMIADHADHPGQRKAPRKGKTKPVKDSQVELTLFDEAG